ncbi:MAG TPA: protein phosphatase 2C domain-containing protein [Kofleriaceae bacterium]|nr:protein phosphatase 2C domain-containing protein [Kofleriaceae bacterium]
MSTDERHPRIRQQNAQLTDVGVIRDHNEDAMHSDPDGDFFIVADGMGGHAAGEVASKMAVDAVRASLETARPEIAKFARGPSDEGRRGLVTVLENAVRQAHQSVFERGAKESDKQGMGTTLDVVLVAGNEAFVAHVGDSRTYLVRDGRAAQITTDHTVAEVLVIEGKLSIEEAQISPLRTILVNAIGVAPDVGVEMAHVRLKRGDRLLLCSDGLHDYFPLEQEVSDHVSEHPPSEALDRMITIAKNRGGHDNITGIVLEVLETPSELDELDWDLPQGLATEDTGSMQALPDTGPPEEMGRDDTMPIELHPSLMAVAERVRGGVPSRPAETKGGASDDEGDIKETQRIRPITAKKPRPRKKRSTKDADGLGDTAPPDDAASSETEEIPKTEDSSSTTRE